MVICDTDFADNIAQMSNTLKQAQLLSLVETSGKQIGLHVNSSKMECTKFSHDDGDFKALKVSLQRIMITSFGGQARTFVDLLEVDTGIPMDCLPAAMVG